MNTHITIPTSHLRAADRLAKHLGLTRNELFRKAIELYLEQRSPECETVPASRDVTDDEEW
jgi:metal-responsive CopG/Arc/MetJ family transcriptional regulator